MKNFIISMGIALISFALWSMIIPKALAIFNKPENILGTETEKTVFSPQPVPSVSPIPSATLKPSPKTAPTATPKVKPSPSATPKPSPTPVTMQQLDEWFTKYANSASVNRDLLKKIADCESEFKPNAVNGPYAGLYQFTKNTWISTRSAMNLNTDPDLRFNPEEAINTAAFRLATQGAGAWPNCGK